MHYIYHINEEDRELTEDEWNQLAEVFFESAGYENSRQEKGSSEKRK